MMQLAPRAGEVHLVQAFLLIDGGSVPDLRREGGGRHGRVGPGTTGAPLTPRAPKGTGR
jgi:hypothetical protein